MLNAVSDWVGLISFVGGYAGFVAFLITFPELLGISHWPLRDLFIVAGVGSVALWLGWSIVEAIFGAITAGVTALAAGPKGRSRL
jgi:hypothetical protein